MQFSAVMAMMIEDKVLQQIQSGDLRYRPGKRYSQLACGSKIQLQISITSSILCQSCIILR